MTNTQDAKLATNQAKAITPEEQAKLRAEMDELAATAALRAELKEREAENKHLFEKAVIAESMVAQMEAYIAELEGKKLAALVLAGEVKPYEFDERRARSLSEMRDRVSNMRRRAEQSVHNMADMRPDRR